MNQLFPKKDQRRRWNGYWIYLSQEKYLDIDEKWGEISEEEHTAIKKFVKRNYQDIMARVEFYLSELGLKLK
jgi:hypothetical protein